MLATDRTRRNAKPTTEEVSTFLDHKSPDGFEKVIDRLLASPRYGEHMARYWLDAVRYGDTHGLHLDNYGEFYPYRDWGKDNSPSRFRVGDLPSPGKWTRLQVKASDVGLNPGAKVSGWAFTQFDGTVRWDKAGLVSMQGQSLQFESLRQWIAFQRSLEKPTVPDDIAVIIAKSGDQVGAEERQRATNYFVEHVYAETRAQFAALHRKIAAPNFTPAPGLPSLPHFAPKAQRAITYFFNATLLHLLGINHRKFTFKHQGLDQRLTGVEPAPVMKDILL